jgi:hypothetical protein
MVARYSESESEAWNPISEFPVYYWWGRGDLNPGSTGDTTRNFPFF